MRRCCMCGSKAEVITSQNLIINKYTLGYKVICSNIGCPNKTDWFETEARAITAWQDNNKKVAQII